MRLIHIYAALAVTQSFLFSLVYLLIPRLRPIFIGEDQFLENLTAIYYFDAFLIGAVLLLLLPKNQVKSYLIGIPAIAFIFFLEEVSYGKNTFGFTPPTFAGKQIDGLHDFVEISIQKFRALPGSFKVVVVLTIFSLVILLLRHYGFKSPQSLGAKFKQLFAQESFLELKNILVYHPLSFYLAMIAGFVILGQLVDIGGIELVTGETKKFFNFLEELCELNASAAFMFASFAIQFNHSRTTASYALNRL